MFNSADRRLYMAQKTYKRNFDRNVQAKRFKQGDYVFVNIPPNEAKSAREKNDSATKGKLAAKAYGPLRIHQVFENVLVLEEDNSLVPTSIDRCTPAPTPREAPSNPNNETSTSEEPVVVQYENDTSDRIVADPVHDDTNTDELSETAPFFIRIVDHTNHKDGRVTYNVQLSDRSISKEVDVNELPYRPVIRYWHQANNPKRNPHTRKRGRPRKKRDAALEDESQTK